MIVDLLLDNGSLVDDLIPCDLEISAILKKASLELQSSLIAAKKDERDRCMDQNGYWPRTLVESPEGKRKFYSPFTPSIGTEYDVRITAYEDDPFEFYVQFASQDDEFQKFQCDLQSYKSDLERLRNRSVGSNCIVIIDGQLHRATILRNDPSISKNDVTVRLMESGIKSLVAVCNLYAIPTHVANVKPFAMLFQLAHMKGRDEWETTKSEMSFIFHRTTNNKPLKLRMAQSKSESSTPLS